jgi:hypothetical protein
MTVTSDDFPDVRARRRRPLTPLVRQPDPKELREWAFAEGFDIAETGRLPDDVQAAWAESELRARQVIVPW